MNSISQNIEIFNNEDFGQVRALLFNGEPWFVGKDVAIALGYGSGKSPINAVTNHVDDEDKGVTEMMTPGGKQKVTVINESGLYSLILGSRLPSAKSFKRWITSDVIPSIRKHGAYATPATIENIISNPDFGIELLQRLKDEQEKRKRVELENEEMKPKAIFADAVAVSDDSILVGALAKLLNQNGVDIGQKRLFAWMRDNGYLIKDGRDKNIPFRVNQISRSQGSIQNQKKISPQPQ